MVTHLYKNFLTNKQVYFQNIDFWKSIIYTVLSTEKIKFNEYLTTTKPDGSLYLDGNPIFNFKIDNSNRAVRIIQEEIETEKIVFSAWINKTTLIDNSEIEELVISLELSNESILLAIELINEWIINKLSTEKIEKLIDKIFTINKLIFKNELLEEVEYA